jgi:hypothetical protein
LAEKKKMRENELPAMFMEAEEFSMSFGKSSSAGTFIKI